MPTSLEAIVESDVLSGKQYRFSIIVVQKGLTGALPEEAMLNLGLERQAGLEQTEEKNISETMSEG